MAKVLIDIPDNKYEIIKNSENVGWLIRSYGCQLITEVKNGTPLPEDFSLENYERYKKDSENLSWIKCPERMGN